MARKYKVMMKSPVSGIRQLADYSSKKWADKFMRKMKYKNKDPRWGFWVE
jgi:hypothetical protein